MRTINIIVKEIPVNTKEEGDKIITRYMNSMPDVWGEVRPGMDVPYKVFIYERVDWYGDEEY